MTDAYREDLAYIHDAGFGALARHAATALIADLNDRSMLSGTVVDLGCGSGITAEVLTNAGYHVLGIDLSEPLIRIARARVPAAEFNVGSFVDTEIPPCIAVTAIGEVLNYLFDPHNGESARSQLFNKIYTALKPGRLFMSILLLRIANLKVECRDHLPSRPTGPLLFRSMQNQTPTSCVARSSRFEG